MGRAAMGVDRREVLIAGLASAAAWLLWLAGHTRLAAPYPALHRLAEPDAVHWLLGLHLLAAAGLLRGRLRGLALRLRPGAPVPPRALPGAPLPLRRIPPGSALARTLVVGLLLAATAACAATDGSAWTAPLRVALASSTVLLLPGLLLLAALDPFQEVADPVEHGVLAVALSYVALLAATVAITLLELPLVAAPALLGGLCLALAPFARRLPTFDADPPARRAVRRGIALGLLAAAAFVVAAAWRLEPLIQGEEMVELVSVRKLLGAPQVTLTNVMHRPDAIPSYIFTPYYVLVAMLVKLSGLPLFAAYSKLRAVYVVLGLAGVYALARRLSGSGAMARAALAGALLLAVVDPDPWTWPASMLPLHRRGGFAAGVLLPALLLVASHAAGPLDRRRAAFASAVASGLLLAMTMTHALDAVLAMFFVGGLALAALAGDARARRRAGVVLAVAVLTLLVYRLVHARVVTHIATYHAYTRRIGVGEALATLRAPLDALLGGVPDGGRYLLVACGAVLPAMTLGALGLPALLAASRPLGLPLAAAVVPGLLVFSAPVAYSLLVSVTTNEICFAASYFGLLGLLSCLGLAHAAADALARRYEGRRLDLALASAAAGLLLLGAAWLAQALLVRWPGLLAPLTALACVAALRRGRPGAPTPVDERWAVVGSLLLLLLPAAVGLKRFPGEIHGSRRESLLAQVWRHDTPSALDAAAHYPHLARTANPRVDLPLPVVEELGRVLAPRQVVVYDPAHSYTVPLLLDQFIVNPGFLISTDYDYFERFVRLRGGKPFQMVHGDDQRLEKGALEHPLFDGDHDGLSDLEREFLRTYRVRYVIANPDHAARIARKLDPEPARFRRVHERDGFITWEVVPRG